MQSWFFDAIARGGGHPAILSPDRPVTSFRELGILVRSTELPAEGTVATWQRNTFDHVLALLAAVSRGRAICPISPRMPPERAVEMARRAGARLLLCEEKPIDPGPPHPVDLNGSDTVIFSSGSSGRPKAVVISPAAHLASARGAATRIPLGPGDSWLLDLPLNHVSGLAVLFRCLDAGAAVQLPGLPSPPTHRSMVAAQLRRSLADGAHWNGLKAALLGGGPVGLDLVNCAIRSGCPLHITYGMTETASQVTTTERLDAPLARVHAGLPLPGRRVHVAPDGAIFVGGNTLARGLLQDDGSIRPLDMEQIGGVGYYKTGDIGALDQDGNLLIAGRSDRMFISGGENIYPEEIERELLALPHLEAAAVVPMADDLFGQRPVAFILGAIDSGQIRERLVQRLPSFKIPTLILPWPTHVPRPEGKLTRDVLGQLAAVVGSGGEWRGKA